MVQALPLIPDELIPILRDQTYRQFNVEIDVYQQSGAKDGQGNAAYPPLGQPTFTTFARVVQVFEEFFDAQGVRQVSLATIYVPVDVVIGPTDRIVAPGEDGTNPAPIIDITQIPTVGIPLMTKIRTGAA